MHFIVKLFPEITIKSTPVRRRFVRQLQHNLQNLLKPEIPSVRVMLGWDKLEVTAELPAGQELAAQQRASAILAHTPGIAYFAPVTVLEFDALEDLAPRLVPLWQGVLADRTFCVRAKRNGEHTFNSMDVEREVGRVLNRDCRTGGVKLQDPDITVRLEIVGHRCYALQNHCPGLGGFPLGSIDSVLSLVSGGFDSTVASYLTMKRGLVTHFCFFNLGGRAHELGVKEVSYFLWRKFGASHNVRFISIPFEDVVGEILQKIHQSQMGVVLKRMMLRVAARVASEMKIKALVTGESVAQVSSQTLSNLRVIDGVTDSLVLRPLITMDKGDIINLARHIGTEDFAANMPEYCGVISVKPTTRATEQRVAKEEANFDFDILEHAFNSRRSIAISEVEQGEGSPPSIDIVNEIPSGAVVIDIRHPDEEEKQPLALTATTLKKIPFYQLSKVFPQLDNTTTYLLYCDKGVMSQLHAAHLSDTGYNNVGVYRPD